MVATLPAKDARHIGQSWVASWDRHERQEVWPHGRQRACLTVVFARNGSLQIEHSLREAIHLCTRNIDGCLTDFFIKSAEDLSAVPNSIYEVPLDLSLSRTE